MYLKYCNLWIGFDVFKKCMEINLNDKMFGKLNFRFLIFVY